jgi:hypothetical protein
MRRRELLLLLGSTITTSSKVRAQQKVMPVIGFLSVSHRLPIPGK